MRMRWAAEARRAIAIGRRTLKMRFLGRRGQPPDYRRSWVRRRVNSASLIDWRAVMDLG